MSPDRFDSHANDRQLRLAQALGEADPTHYAGRRLEGPYEKPLCPPGESESMTGLAIAMIAAFLILVGVAVAVMVLA